ncbi:MAG: efflux RND transporter permease subunit [Breznakibacter sp.]
MVKFLIHRPIAVITVFIAVMVLGLFASGMLPVSLLPDIDIPEITVQISRPGTSVREVEQSVVSVLRRQLMQVPHLADLESESREGTAIIRLKFNYGADINYAFIDVNEKVDVAMRALPSDMERPVIIKASASDLPVFYISLWLKTPDNQRFLELSNLARSVLCKRLEQLPQVAMVDVTGFVDPELFIEPNEPLLQSLGLTHQNILTALDQNNIMLGSLQVMDGQFCYNVRFLNSVRTVDDVKGIYIKTGNRLMTLGELTNIGMRVREPKGSFLRGDEKALSLAVIKQADAQMDDLKNEVDGLLNSFARDYPDVGHEVVRDQTTILDFSINNLKQNLIYGGLLGFIILFFFLKDARSPWIIGLSVPISIVISLLCFHLIGMSLNIISLSGLILAVGNIIDSSIIVIDNITQHMQRGRSLVESCTKGTQEVIRPLISSVFTSCAVFVPLIFISGISGALFYDQALAVTVGLFTSLIVSITLIPVLYRLFWLRNEDKAKGRPKTGHVTLLLEKINLFRAENLYERGFRRVFAHRKKVMAAFVFIVVAGGIIGWIIPKSRFPEMPQTELTLHIDWNEKVNLSANETRLAQLFNSTKEQCLQANFYVGTQQFVLHKGMDQTLSEALAFFSTSDPEQLNILIQHIKKWFTDKYPNAIISFCATETVFERLFSNNEPFLTVKLSGINGLPELGTALSASADIASINGIDGISGPPTEHYLDLKIKPELLSLYEVDYNTLYAKLKASLNSWQIGILHTGSQYLPIVLSNTPDQLDTLLAELKIPSKTGAYIPANAVLEIRNNIDYKNLHAGKEGVYLPINITAFNGNVNELMAPLQQQLFQKYGLDASFSGSWFSSRILIKELFIVLLISILLLYFILAAQFESLSQPLILLIEVPIDIAGALILLYFCGGTLNIMSMIGLVVMSGVIVNDSILKIDTINQLRRTGMPLMQAIEEGGRMRLNSIIMTSLTSILALVPVLWGTDIGSILQRPLAITVITGMVLGTLVSLYFIPICYYYLYRKSQLNQ